MLVRFYILVILCKIVSKHIFSQFCNLLNFSSKNLKICPIKREENRHLQASLCQRKQLEGCWDCTFGEIRKIRQENSSQDYSTTGDEIWDCGRPKVQRPRKRWLFGWASETMVSSDPTFCENEDEKGDTIRTENYITMLRGKVLRVLKRKQKHNSCIFNKTDPSSLLS